MVVVEVVDVDEVCGTGGQGHSSKIGGLRGPLTHSWDGGHKGSHPERKVQFFLTLFKRGAGGGGVIPMFKNYVVNFV